MFPVNALRPGCGVSSLAKLFPIGAPLPPGGFMRGQFHTAQFQSGWVESIFRSSGGGAARKRRCRPVPPQYRVPDSRRTEIPERGHRTRVRLARSSPAQLGGRMHPGLVSHHGAEQRSTPVGGSTTPFHQCSREAAWWDGPGPALPRGPSFDGLKTDSTVSMDGRSLPSGEAVRAHPHQTVRS